MSNVQITEQLTGVPVRGTFYHSGREAPQIVHQCTGVGRMNVSKCTSNGPSTLASASLV